MENCDPAPLLIGFQSLQVARDECKSQLLSFVACHGLSVTRSKAAAGRRNKAAYLPTPTGYDRWMGESLARCFASGRGINPLPAQSPCQSILQSPDEGLWYLRRRDGNKICFLTATQWRRRRENWRYALFVYLPAEHRLSGRYNPKDTSFTSVCS